MMFFFADSIKIQVANYFSLASEIFIHCELFTHLNLKMGKNCINNIDLELTCSYSVLKAKGKSKI